MKTKFPFWFFLLSAYILFIGRNNVYLGSVLYFLEYPYILIGGWMLWRQRKHPPLPKLLKMSLLFAVVILCGDAIYLFLNQQKPTSTAKNTSKSEQIEVMTYNLLFTNSSPQTSLQFLQKYPVDILALQEVTPKWKQLLKKSIFLQKNYPFQKYHADKGTHGYGIFSKYSVKNVEYLNNDAGRPIAQCFEIELSKQSIYTCNAHTASPAIAFHSPKSFPISYYEVAKLREQQWKQITEHIDKKAVEIPTRMIVGDINTPDFEPLYYRQVQQSYVDAFAEVGDGMGFTFPRGRLPYPVFRLDYILTQGGLNPIEAKVLEKTGSDHFGVKAKFDF